MEASIGINIRGHSSTACVSKKDKDDKKKAGQSYTAFCESFSSDVSTLRDGCGRQIEKMSKEEEEEEDHSKTVHVLAPEKLLLIELKALFAKSYPPLSTTCKVRIYTTKRKQQENRFNSSYRVNTPSASFLQCLLTNTHQSSFFFNLQLLQSLLSLLLDFVNATLAGAGTKGSEIVAVPVRSNEKRGRYKWLSWR